jgi:hypothetical protein
VLRDDINNAWKEFYCQLGRNKTKPLNEDDFLRVHWISYFKYSRDTGRDYARFLLDEHFTPQNVHDLVERLIELETVEEQRSETVTDKGGNAVTGIPTIPESSAPHTGASSRLKASRTSSRACANPLATGSTLSTLISRLTYRTLKGPPCVRSTGSGWGTSGRSPWWR